MPLCTSTKLPVPYVTLPAPIARHPCPYRAACWSPASPRIGNRTPRISATPNSATESTISGSNSRSTPNSASSSSSQSSVASEQSSVREAFVRSVRWAAPDVSRQTSHESTVPNASPLCGRSRSSHSSFVAEKYGSGTSPVRSRIRSLSSSRQRSAVRRSCQTIAGATGRPVLRSQTTVVSRWLAMPIAASSAAGTPAAASAASAACRTPSQISSGSCSTQPGFGKRCASSR